MRIFIIGFMCSGKSTVGRLLAARLGLPFIDIDRVVEARVGPLLPFIRDHGEAAFRAAEKEALEGLLGAEAAVIATGGGTPMHGDGLDRMTAAGTVVWLRIAPADLLPRIIRSGGDRPLLFGLKGDALAARVMALLSEREPVYARARLAVDASRPPEQVAEAIEGLLRPDAPGPSGRTPR
jgi:shikimate kinase